MAEKNALIQPNSYEKGKMAKMLFGLIGTSNSGKTTLVKALIEWFKLEGYSVSCIKHAHKGFDLDRPGKDSFEMREAGAYEVLLVGDKRWVLMHEYETTMKLEFESLVERLAPCDLVMVEGFKESGFPQIEVYRPSTGKQPLWPIISSVVAVATDEYIDCNLPTLNLNNPSEIAGYILHLLGHLERMSTKTN